MAYTEHWLWRENLDEEFLSALSTQTKSKETHVAPNGETGQVMRYDKNDPKLVRDQMRRVLKIGKGQFLKFWNEKKGHVTFQGIQKLIEAAECKDQPLLRKGQILFGTRSAAWYLQYKDQLRKHSAPEAWLYNVVAPIYAHRDCGEVRTYSMLHGAVYAGKYAALNCDYCRDNCEDECIGHHWVIENIGAFKDKKIDCQAQDCSQVKICLRCARAEEVKSKKIGRITARPLEKAFEENAEFFVLSPPKDSNGRSTRSILLQRALACLGLEYEFNITGASCENFVMTLLLCSPEEEPDRLQTGTPEAVIKPSKGFEIECQAQECSQNQKCSPCKRVIKMKTRNQKFRMDIFRRVSEVPEGVLLSMSYYINHIIPSRAKNGWYKEVQKDYERLFKAIKR